MNRKHLACLVVVLGIVAFVQTTLWMRNKLADSQEAEEKVRGEAQTAAVALQTEQVNLTNLKNQSSDLIEFLNTWRPHFETIDSPEGGELNISMRIKEAGLVALSQRYEVAANKADSTIRRIVRAHLTFEDDYVETLNWLGLMESRLPSLRVGSAKITRGQNANEIRMELVLELPIFASAPASS